MFFNLQALEKQIDERILAKQIQIADASFKTSKVKRTLKLFVSNTVESVQLDSGEPLPGWALRIEGKLETYGRHGRLANRKLSHYFQSLHVEFNPNPDGTGETTLIEWINGPNVAESDGFEVKRTGTPSNKRVTIVLKLSNLPERFKLSTGLSTVLSMPTGSRPEIVLAVWQYIKLHKLQESDEKKTILNNGPLRELFGVEKMNFSDIPSMIQPHLLPLDPVVIEYDLNFEHGGGLLVTDFEVELDDPAKSRPPVTPSIASIQRELGIIDQRVSECIGAMKTSHYSFKVLEMFAEEPLGTVNALVARHTADVETIVGDVSISREDLNRASVYDGEDIDQAISTLLASMRPFI